MSTSNTEISEEIENLEILEYERENIKRIVIKIKTEHDKEEDSVEIIRKCEDLLLFINSEIGKRKSFVRDALSVDFDANFDANVDGLKKKHKIKVDSIVEIWEQSYLISLECKNLVPNLNSLILEYRKRRNQSPD
jgi:hypothetical protein